MGKQRAIKLKLNRTFEEKEFEQDDALHIKDGDSKVQFEPACVFDETGQTGGRLKRLKRLLFLLPALIFFVAGLNLEGIVQSLLLIEGLFGILAGAIAIGLSFWFGSGTGKRKLVLFVDGCLKALKFSESTEELQIAWTPQEAKEYVHKQIALEQERFKAMKTWQFLVIIVLLVITIICLVKIGATIGAF